MTVSAADISLAFKGGLNIAKWRGGEKGNSVNFTGGIPEDKKSKTGMCAGMGLGINFSDFIALQPELLFSMKGYKQIFKLSNGENNELVLKVNYFEAPILLKISIPAGIVKPNFYMGPALAFRIRITGHCIIDGEKEEFNKDQNFALNNHVRIFDFGLAMGGGIDIKTGPGSIILDFRYTLGLREVWFGSYVNTNLPKDKNGTLSFILGYAINF